MDRDLRRAQRSGDRTALLAARLRAGEVTQAHVALAASLGHSAALALMPEVERVDWDDSGARKTAISDATSLVGETLPARVAADFAERLLSKWEEQNPRDTRPRDAIAAARAWAECPCDAHRAEAHVAATAAKAASETPHDPRILIVSFSMADFLRISVASAAGSAAFAAGRATPVADAEHAASSIHHIAEGQEAEQEWQRLRLAGYALGEIEAVD